MELKIRILINYKRAERVSASQDRFRSTELLKIHEAREINNQMNVTYLGYILRSAHGHNLRQIHQKSMRTINSVTITL